MESYSYASWNIATWFNPFSFCRLLKRPLVRIVSFSPGMAKYPGNVINNFSIIHDSHSNWQTAHAPPRGWLRDLLELLSRCRRRLIDQAAIRNWKFMIHPQKPFKKNLRPSSQQIFRQGGWSCEHRDIAIACATELTQPHSGPRRDKYRLVTGLDRQLLRLKWDYSFF